MPPVGFEPTISAGERPQTHVLECAPTGTSNSLVIIHALLRTLDQLFDKQ